MELRHDQRDRRLLVWILLVSVLLHNVTCKGPEMKRTSSTCHCHKDIGRCITKDDGSQVCSCPERYRGRMCEFDCRKASDKECQSLRSWSICVKHRDWMQACCKRTCEGFKNTCADVNPVDCKWLESHGECKKNLNWMRTCCGLCFDNNPKCKDKNPIQCPLWKERGECEKNIKYMYKNCLKSCIGC
ncbi:putative tyrosinase-like protein tyr-3 [Actinia tenebrosa]|uniref:Tyrosinase-like protein tyr-3 n=1 Tax=Actinia tenebrosa TaxID=6105 RepID=A0A6P8HCX4_ACTTE|nr:putative tyrosinase-like protein tyr-3 [Actinia tenebrosa]